MGKKIKKTKRTVNEHIAVVRGGTIDEDTLMALLMEKISKKPQI